MSFWSISIYRVWVLSWLLRTKLADVIRFMTVLTSLVVKILLVLRLWAIWNKDFMGERTRNMYQWTCYIDKFNSSHADSIFHDDRYVLICDYQKQLMVGISWGPGRLKTLYNTYSLTDLIFQVALSATILGAYIASVFGMSLPLHGCWTNSAHFAVVQSKLVGAF